MLVDDKMRAALAKPLTRQILRAVVRNKSVRLPDLVSTEVSHDVALAAIKELTEARLIKENKAPIVDLNTYFVTADGLAANRQVAD